MSLHILKLIPSNIYNRLCQSSKAVRNKHIKYLYIVYYSIYNSEQKVYIKNVYYRKVLSPFALQVSSGKRVDSLSNRPYNIVHIAIIIYHICADCNSSKNAVVQNISAFFIIIYDFMFIF